MIVTKPIEASVRRATTTTSSPDTCGFSALRSELLRCDREIAEIETHHSDPAYLVTLGIEDWRHEERLIEQEVTA